MRSVLFFDYSPIPTQPLGMSKRAKDEREVSHKKWLASIKKQPIPMPQADFSEKAMLEMNRKARIEEVKKEEPKFKDLPRHPLNPEWFIGHPPTEGMYETYWTTVDHRVPNIGFKRWFKNGEWFEDSHRGRKVGLRGTHVIAWRPWNR